VLADERLMKDDNWSRVAFVVTSTVLGLWALWALIGATTGFGKLSYAAFGLISPEVGLVCAVLNGIGLLRARRAGRSMRYALGGLFFSALVAVVPLTTLLTVCDGCMS
jgi:hypothetical protein